MLLGLVAGIGALGWNQYTWQRAVRQLEEVGIMAVPQDEHLGERLWRTAKADWRQLFKAGTWQTKPVIWMMAPDRAGSLRNLDALAPALRRINPEFLYLVGCPALENVDGLKGLATLQVLHLSGCTALQNVDGLKGLTALQMLDLSGCTALQNADVLKGLTALQDLYLYGCPALQDVDGLKGLTALQWVHLSRCPKLSPEQVAALRAALPKANIRYW